MATSRLDELLPAAYAEGGEPTHAVNALSLLRASHVHRPEVVIALAPEALNTLRPRSVEYWDIQEQLAQAAAETGSWTILTKAVTAIRDRFINSDNTGARARLATALQLEARSQWSESLRTYVELLADDPLCRRAYKRQVAVLKASRRAPEAIALLNHYLTHFATDSDAWAELAALCLEHNRIAHAVYAASELVLCEPNNHSSHTLAGDAYLTSGSAADALHARKHYAASLASRREGNLRALYGLWLSSSVVARSAPSKEDSDHNGKMLQWAKNAIMRTYSEMADYSFVTEVIEDGLPKTT